MGATLSSPSRGPGAELDELRRRAYGPGDGLAGDPVALARLIELEDQLHPRVAPDPPQSPHPAADPVLSQADSSPLATLDDASPSRRSVVQPAAPAHTPVVSRRGRRGGILAGVAAAVATIAVVASISPARGDVILHPRADIPAAASVELSSARELDYLGIAADDVRLYDEFRGLNIWSGPRGTSTTCMFVTTDARPRWRVDCAPWNGEPSIDLVKYRESSRLSGVEAWGDMPIGSMIRLVLRDGAVIAQTVGAPPVADAG